jgi:hypothetical protein
MMVGWPELLRYSSAFPLPLPNRPRPRPRSRYRFSWPVDECDPLILRLAVHSALGSPNQQSSKIEKENEGDLGGPETGERRSSLDRLEAYPTLRCDVVTVGTRTRRKECFKLRVARGRRSANGGFRTVPGALLKSGN